MSADHLSLGGPVRGEAPSGGIVGTLIRRGWIVGACVLVTVGIVLVVSLLQTAQYTASASLLFRDPGFDQQLFDTPVFNDSDPDRVAATNIRLVSLRVVADLTAEDLSGDLNGADITEKVTIESDPASDVVTISATDPSPESAAVIANTFAENYIDFRISADRSKVREAAALVEEGYEDLPPDQQQGSAGEALQRQISRLQALEAVQTGNAELAQRAEVPTAASSPRTGRNVLLAGVLGLVLGLGLALLAERLNKRLRDPREFEEAFGGLPVLASIPDCKPLRQPHGGIRELLSASPDALGMLRTRLRYFNVDREVKSVLVTSAEVGEGKTTIAWNLAASAASAGARTILVEADFHRPSVAERARATPIPGLSELLSGQSSLERTVQSLPVHDREGGVGPQARVDVIVAGSHPPAPARLLESAEMERCLGGLTAEYEMVVIDTPPISRIADAIPLLTKVDGVLVVVQSNKTTRDEAIELSEQLRSLDAPVLGLVANRVSSRVGYSGYYGDYGRGNV